MGRASYKAPSLVPRLNIRPGDGYAALAADPDPNRRGDHRSHLPPSHVRVQARGYPGQHGEAWQGYGGGNRRGQRRQQVRKNKMHYSHQWHKKDGRCTGQKQQHHFRGKRYFNRGDKLGQRRRGKYLMKQVLRAPPCALSSNGCRRRGGQHRPPVHRLQRGQPGKAHRKGHDWRSNPQQLQRTKPLRQDQASGQSSSGQEEVLSWKMKEVSFTNLHMPVTMLQECLRPMNMAGSCHPGMCAPHNTSQYIMEQHEYTWRNEDGGLELMSGGSSNHNTEAEDFPLHSMAQEHEDTSTEGEEEESTQLARQY